MKNGYQSCGCPLPHGPPKLIVVTGGPGAGKTAILELARRVMCEHVDVLPEAATIVFGGGFPRELSIDARQCAQRAIARVQREMETLSERAHKSAVTLCDRGTLDGLAYWPGETSSFWHSLGTTHAAELVRYAAVIHLRVPSHASGYGNSNPLRTETAEEAATIDGKILDAWSGHPRRFVVESSADFMEKVVQAISLMRAEMPSCCLHGAAAQAPVRLPEARRLHNE